MNSIVVGESTQRATEQAIDYRELNRSRRRASHSRYRRGKRCRHAPRIAVEQVQGATLVGRGREVALLEDALARVLAEHSSQLVTIVGVPGIGKSRLVLELYEEIERLPGADLLAPRPVPALRRGHHLLGARRDGEGPARDPRRRRRATPPSRSSPSAVGDQWVPSHLRPLVGLAGGVEGGGDKRDEAFAAWRRYFEELAAERPLVLVFEDLHWADDNLLEFVDHLVDWAAAVPLLVVCTARPELLTRRPDWGGGKPNALTVSLSALSDDDTARLLRELLGAVLPAETQVELIARAGGNPLYAEEFARMLRDRGLVGELPETVQGLIAARLDLLEPDQKSLLQDAAVIGRRFWTGRARALCASAASLEADLHSLERKEFVRRERASSVADDLEYAFRHLLVRDVAYGQIPRADRAEKHLLRGPLDRTARPARGPRRDAGAPLSAGARADRGGGRERGGVRGRRPGGADRRGRPGACPERLRGRRPLLPGGARAPRRADDARRARCSSGSGSALALLGETDFDLLERGARRAAGGGGRRREPPTPRRRCARSTGSTGTATRRWTHLGEARRLVEPLPPSQAKARVIATASRLLMLAAHEEDAIRVGEEALAMATDLGLDEIRAAALINIGAARGALGDDAGLAEIAQGVEIARAANAVFEMCRGIGNLAARRWARGELVDADRAVAGGSARGRAIRPEGLRALVPRRPRPAVGVRARRLGRGRRPGGRLPR